MGALESMIYKHHFVLIVLDNYHTPVYIPTAF